MKLKIFNILEIALASSFISLDEKLKRKIAEMDGNDPIWGYKDFLNYISSENENPTETNINNISNIKYNNASYYNNEYNFRFNPDYFNKFCDLKNLLKGTGIRLNDSIERSMVYSYSGINPLFFIKEPSVKFNDGTLLFTKLSKNTEIFPIFRYSSLDFKDENSLFLSKNYGYFQYINNLFATAGNPYSFLKLNYTKWNYFQVFTFLASIGSFGNTTRDIQNLLAHLEIYNKADFINFYNSINIENTKIIKLPINNKLLDNDNTHKRLQDLIFLYIQVLDTLSIDLNQENKVDILLKSKIISIKYNCNLNAIIFIVLYSIEWVHCIRISDIKPEFYQCTTFLSNIINLTGISRFTILDLKRESLILSNKNIDWSRDETLGIDDLPNISILGNNIKESVGHAKLMKIILDNLNTSNFIRFTKIRDDIVNVKVAYFKSDLNDKLFNNINNIKNLKKIVLKSFDNFLDLRKYLNISGISYVEIKYESKTAVFSLDLKREEYYKIQYFRNSRSFYSNPLILINIDFSLLKRLRDDLLPLKEDLKKYNIKVMNDNYDDEAADFIL